MTNPGINNYNTVQHAVRLKSCCCHLTISVPNRFGVSVKNHNKLLLQYCIHELLQQLVPRGNKIAPFGLFASLLDKAMPSSLLWIQAI